MRLEKRDEIRQNCYLEEQKLLRNKPEYSALLSAVNLIESISKITDLNDPNQMYELELNISIANELHHLPSQGML